MYAVGQVYAMRMWEKLYWRQYLIHNPRSWELQWGPTLAITGRWELFPKSLMPASIECVVCRGYVLADKCCLHCRGSGHQTNVRLVCAGCKGRGSHYLPREAALIRCEACVGSGIVAKRPPPEPVDTV